MHVYESQSIFLGGYGGVSVSRFSVATSKLGWAGCSYFSTKVERLMQGLFVGSPVKPSNGKLTGLPIVTRGKTA